MTRSASTLPSVPGVAGCSSLEGSEGRKQLLIEAAAAVGERAYAPYSHFAVGAAVRTRLGGLYVGCNVENVSYPVGVCAERNAIAAAVAAEGPGMVVDSIAVVARNSDGPAPCSPCGACRQAIQEFGNHAGVYYRGPDLEFRCEPIWQLLPGPFAFNSSKQG